MEYEDDDPSASPGEIGLDLAGVDTIIEKVEDEELKNALRVVRKHLTDGREDRNETTWGVFGVDGFDLIFGISQY